MRNLFIGVAAAASLLGASTAFGQTQTDQNLAAPAPRLIFGVDRASDMPTPTLAQFIYLGRQYCWYPGGWRGPGFYWCGYAWRRGFGWGGPIGWQGFSYRGGQYYQGGSIYRGGGGGFGGAASRGGVRTGGVRAGGGQAAARSGGQRAGGGHANTAHGGGGKGGDHKPGG